MICIYRTTFLFLLQVIVAFRDSNVFAIWRVKELFSVNILTAGTFERTDFVENI